ncbi:MAG: hypothetical protein U0936_02150 [Planctomycetaceae bacterium]
MLAEKGDEANTIFESEMALVFRKHVAINDLAALTQKAFQWLKRNLGAYVDSSVKLNLGMAAGVVVCCGLLGWFTAEKCPTACASQQKPPSRGSI